MLQSYQGADCKEGEWRVGVDPVCRATILAGRVKAGQMWVHVSATLDAAEVWWLLGKAHHRLPVANTDGV